MKKITVLILAAATLTSTGCERRSSFPIGGDKSGSVGLEMSSNVGGEINPGLMKLSELKSGLEAQIETIKTAGYANVSLADDFSASVPDADKLYNTTLTLKELSFEEYYKQFDAAFDDIFAGVYGEADKEELYHVSVRGGSVGEYGSDSARLKNHIEKLKNGELDFHELYIDADKGYLSMHHLGGGIYGFTLGGAAKRAEPDSTSRPAMRFASDFYSVAANYLDVDSTNTYALLDKEVSVSEAVRTVKKIVSNKGYSWGGALAPDVSQIRVFDIGEGKYGYSFTMTPSYKGVPFDVYESTTDTGMSIYTKNWYNGRDYQLFPCEVFMMESDKLDYLVAGRGVYDVSESVGFEEAIPLDKAAEILSSSFGAGMQLSVSRAELLYAAYSEGETENQTNMNAVPVWKFRCHNIVDDLKYIVYVNAVDGSVEYYTCDWWEI